MKPLGNNSSANGGLVNNYRCGVTDGGRFNTFDKFYIASLFFYCFLLFAPTAYAIVPFLSVLAGALRFAIAGGLALFALHQAVRRGSVRVNKGLLFISFAFVLLAILPSAYHATTYLLFKEFISFYLVYMLFLFYKREYLQPIITMATVFMLIMLVFSIIGFVYAFLGFPPVATGMIGGGSGARTYYWYLTTGAVDNGIIGNIIRPQAIFDEPGGFSFLICSLCFLRVFAKRRDSVTLALLLLGNITFSMIHIMIFALFVLHLLVKYKMKKAFVVYAVVILGMIFLSYLPVREQVDDLLLARFAFNKATGTLEGNNRMFLMRNAMGLVKQDNSVLIWGLPRDGDGLTIMDKVWGYGENPLAPALKFGIFIAWLYYLYLAFFASCSLIDRKNFFIYLSIFLMLLQRPEFYRGGPAAAVLLLLFTSWDMINKRQVPANKQTAAGQNAIPGTNETMPKPLQGATA